MMHGQLLFFAGFGFLLDALAMFLLLPVVILMTHVFIVLLEEPNLKKRFGQEWMDYTKRVPRWLPKHSSTQEDLIPKQV
jgi:protein-S-isoprenylcysteine O-methyltransferase Ste14